MIRKLLTGVSLLAVTALIGCGGGNDFPDPVPVSGSIKLNNEPVADAKVTFVAKGKEGRSASGTTDAEGKFTLTTFNTGDGAIPGTYVVTVVKNDGSTSADMGYDAENEEGMGEDYGKMMDAAGGGDGGPVVDTSLPQKYASPATSGIERTVADSGPNEFAIELE